jgi:hypothetical protein
LVVVAIAGPLAAALAHKTWPFWLGMTCGVGAVLATFAHVTHGTDTRFVWWVATALFCAAGVGLMAGAWLLRPVPALGGLLCLGVAVAITWAELGASEETAARDPHPDSSFHIVAIGDSYMSGEGAARYFHGTDDPRTNRCHRAASAYPYLVADEIGASLIFAACSGARTYHITERGQYPRSVDVVGA